MPVAAPPKPETVARKKPSRQERRELRDRIDLRCELDWYGRVMLQADRFGVSISDYIREATTRRLEADEATDPREEADD